MKNSRKKRKEIKLKDHFMKKKKSSIERPFGIRTCNVDMKTIGTEYLSFNDT